MPVNMERFNSALDSISSELRQLAQQWPQPPNTRREVECISVAEGILAYIQTQKQMYPPKKVVKSLVCRRVTPPDSFK